MAVADIDVVIGGGAAPIHDGGGFGASVGRLEPLDGSCERPPARPNPTDVFFPVRTRAVRQNIKRKVSIEMHVITCRQVGRGKTGHSTLGGGIRFSLEGPINTTPAIQRLQKEREEILVATLNSDTHHHHAIHQPPNHQPNRHNNHQNHELTEQKNTQACVNLPRTWTPRVCWLRWDIC